MSVPTLAQLLLPKTQDQWTQLALSQLLAVGFPTTDWSSTSNETGMLKSDTICLADQSQQIPQIVALVLVYYAIGAANPALPAPPSLVFVAYNWYQITAFTPTPAVGIATLTCNSLAGPYTIAVGQLTATDALGNLFTNLTGGGLATSGTLTPTWQALTPGASPVTNNNLTGLLTPLPGVSINNPGPAFSPVTAHNAGTGSIIPSGAVSSANWRVQITTTGGLGAGVFKIYNDGGVTPYISSVTIPGGGTYGPDGQGLILTFAAGTYITGDYFDFTTPGSWLTVSQGTDPESTLSLATRILARWPQLADVANFNVYEAWALEAGQGITRVKVITNPNVAATVDVYIAGPVLPASIGQVTGVQNYINPRAGVTDVPVVIAATTTGVALTGNATYPIGQPTIPATQNSIINAYINSITMGGTILVAEIEALALAINAAGQPTGATNITGVQLNAGGVGVDLTLGATSVATITNSLVWTPA